MGLKRKDETEKYSFICSYIKVFESQISVHLRTRSKVFNVEETELLIKEVRKHPCIYDSSLPDHKNESVKELARASIAQKFKDCSEYSLSSCSSSVLPNFNL